MTLQLGREFPVLAEELPEPGPRAAQPRFDGADGDPFGFGGLLVAQPLDVAEHDDDPLVWRQRLEPALDHADGLGAECGTLRADAPVGEAGLVAALLDDDVEGG